MKSQQESLSGVAYASAAFLIWGLSPIYWKVLHNIPVLEIIMHRTVWSFVFLLIILVFQRHGIEFMAHLFGSDSYHIAPRVQLVHLYLGGEQ